MSGYLNNEEEMRFKKIIWEEMNKEYIQVKDSLSLWIYFYWQVECTFSRKQSRDILTQMLILLDYKIYCSLYGFQEQAAAAAAKMESQTSFQNSSDELRAAHELAAAAAAAVAKSRKVLLYMSYVAIFDA